MNQVFIAGRLGVDPEVRFTPSGLKVTTLRVACNSRKSGKEETIWWKVTIWGEQFDKMLTYFKKGSAIMVMGELSKPEIFNDREGKPQISLNITANNLMFSPFGKSDPKNEESGFVAKPAFQKTDDMITGNDALSGAFQQTQMVYGQKDASEFSDEDVPF